MTVGTSNRFALSSNLATFSKATVLKDSPAARYERFLFHKIFHRDTLLTRGGKCLLEALIQQQRFSDRN